MNSFSKFFTNAARKSEDPDEKDKIYRLRRMAIDSVHLVTAGANKRTFLIRKDEGATMKTADMIPGAEGIKNAAGVVVTKADAMAGADEDLKKLIEKMEAADSGSPEGLVDSLKNISKVLASVSQKADPAPEEEAPAAEEEAPTAPVEEELAEKADGSDGDEESPVAKSADPFDVIDAQLEVVQKAGRKISKGNMAILTKAMDLLQKLSGDLTPEEKKVVQDKVANISKSLVQSPAAQHIPDGNSNPSEVPVQAPESGGWTAFEDINQSK